MGCRSFDSGASVFGSHSDQHDQRGTSRSIGNSEKSDMGFSQSFGHYVWQTAALSVIKDYRVSFCKWLILDLTQSGDLFINAGLFSANRENYCEEIYDECKIIR
jgi:hypothetical protein